MQGLLLDLIAGLLRHFLTGAAGWLISNGILNADQVNQLIAGVALALVSALLLLWHKVKNRQLQVTLGALPAGTTIAEAKSEIKAGVAASPLTPSDQSPSVTASVLRFIDKKEGR